jgi:hypothetical protein
LSISVAICPAICRYNRIGSTVCNGTRNPLRIWRRRRRRRTIARRLSRRRCELRRLYARSRAAVKWPNHRTKNG